MGITNKSEMKEYIKNRAIRGDKANRIYNDVKHYANLSPSLSAIKKWFQVWRQSGVVPNSTKSGNTGNDNLLNSSNPNGTVSRQDGEDDNDDNDSVIEIFDNDSSTPSNSNSFHGGGGGGGGSIHSSLNLAQRQPTSNMRMSLPNEPVDYLEPLSMNDPSDFYSFDGQPIQCNVFLDFC